MLAFAGNSLLCRMALKQAGMDPASFTSVRMLSGAAVLLLLAGRPRQPAGSWGSALALFVYAAAFSFAYVNLEAGTGTLLLFGAGQLTMIGYGCWRGERVRISQWFGLALGTGGLAALLLPGASAPPAAQSALLMLTAGVAWGVYSLRGPGHAKPLQATAGNFLRAVPFAVLLGAWFWPAAGPGLAGLALAAASGAVASGVGYAIWYSALPGLRSSQAAAAQLSVPVIAAIGGAALLGEAITAHQAWASAAILGGVALVVLTKEVEV
jgi:drug/metabolite transporter (DMT)-like permease